MIFHYCDKNAFESIIEKKIIWLSDITKMNDESEYKSGFDIIRNIINKHSEIDDPVVTEMSEKNLNLTFQVLIACFSHKGDMLSQWRYYGDDGKGFSIGFDLETIKQHNMFNRYLERMEPILSKVEFIEVNYNKGQFETEIQQLVNLYKEQTSPIKYKLLARQLMYMAIRYKDSFFIEEREVRAFIAPEKINNRDDFHIEQRNSKHGKTNYHKLNTSFHNIHAINKIIIGPKNTEKLNDVKDFLSHHGLENIPVLHSSGYGKYR